MEIPDNYDMWLNNENRKNKISSRFPKCERCCDPAADDFYFVIFGKVICASCVEECKVYDDGEYEL